MEDLNNKLAGLRDTVKKIKKEIKSFEENESKNIQNRAGTLSNKIYRPLSYSKKIPFNRLNKKLMKNYFKLSLKEQNNNNKQLINNKKNKNIKINNNDFKEIMTPQNFKKKINRAKLYSNNTNSRIFNNKYNNNYNSDENNLYEKNYLVMTDINNINNKTDSCMNKNIYNFLSTRNKNYSWEKKEKNKNNKIDKNINTYSNNDFKKNIFLDYFTKNKNNKKKFLYNENNNYNTSQNNNENNEIFFNNTNNNLNMRQSLLNDNSINNSLIHTENNIFNIKKNKNNINQNNSYNGRIKLITNPNKSNKTIYKKKNYNYGTFRTNFINNDNNKNNYGNNLFNLKDYSNNVYNMTQEFFNYNKKPKIFPTNNTINYISNKNDISLILRDEEINKDKNKIKEIIENYSIGDLYIKAKLFEKCGQDNFNYFVNNFCESNNLINNLKKYKNYLIKIKEEENQYKKQINIYQKLCKKLMELMNPNQINDIINEIQDIENQEENIFLK